MNGCINWPGRLASTGYVNVWVNGRPQLLHRLLWEQLHGPIPDGMCIDHICANRACINPDHYEVVTPAENAQRVGERRTHCKNGHPIDDANVFWYQASGKRGAYRGCRICRVEANRAWRQRRSQSV